MHVGIIVSVLLTKPEGPSREALAMRSGGFAFGKPGTHVDWHSRYVLAWRLSDTVEAGFCAEALEEALGHGQPEVFNTDLGSQFTSREFTQVLQNSGLRISMNRQGRYSYNIVVERLCRIGGLLATRSPYH